MDVYEQLAQATGFAWDAGNVEKNWLTHRVSAAECEQVFFNEPLLAAEDIAHSRQEPRFFGLGQTDAGRLLFLAFTLRGSFDPGDLRPRHEPQRTTGVPQSMKKIPQFASEEEERAFWEEHDSAEYVPWRQGRRMVLPNLRPSTKTISLRLPEHMLEELKLLANKRDVPYQSLLKMYLGERIEQELRTSRQRAS